MQTGKSTIKDVFDGTRIFNVPVYQRSYSWREDNLTDFLTDLMNQYKDRKYFLGSFLFHLNGSREEFSIIDIVDGQQRLTTFVIFINVLIEKLILKKSKLVSKRTKRIFIKDEDVFKLELENEDSSFLHNVILSPSNKKKQLTKTPSQTLLLKAKSYFSKALSDMEIEKLEKLYEISTEADVLLYVVDKINTATQIFELLNDRGRKLTDLEAIKSFLMYNIGLVSKHPDQLINNIQSEFAEIYRLIEKHELNELDVLRYHTIAFERCQINPKEFIKGKVSRLINEDKLDEARSVIKNFPFDLHKSFELYVEISTNKDDILELSNLFMIGRVAPFYPAMLKVKNDQPNRFREFVNYVNKFTFRASLVGLRSNGESYINTKLGNKEDVVDLANAFTRDNWWNINKRTIDVISYSNYYEWLSKNAVRYILFTYENKLRRGKYPLLSEKEYFQTTKKGARLLNIEHITARKVQGLNLDDDFKENYLNNVGNLVIDYIVPNISNSNKNTEEKIEEYNLAPLMSKNKIDDSTCNWRDLESVKEFINKREKIIKEFIMNEFEIE